MDGLIAYALSKKYTDEVGRSILDAGFKTQVEQDRSILQTTGQEKILYFIPKTTAKPSDGYDEYVYSNNAWEQIGATDVDLSSYATKAEIGDLDNLPTTDKSSIVSAISETFTSVSNGKSLVASAITDKGISTSSDATFEIMAQNIEAIPSGAPVVQNPALILWDWEGTKLAEYSREDALALTELPTPNTLTPYAEIDHEWLVFQEWNWNLTDIKDWVQKRRYGTLDVGAIYTTIDGEIHKTWPSSRLIDSNSISKYKTSNTNIAYGMLQNKRSLRSISVPYGSVDAYNYAFSHNQTLKHFNVPSSITTLRSGTFADDYALEHIVLPNTAIAAWGEAFYNCTNLKNINIDHWQGVSQSVFQGCCNLTQIYLSQTILNIGDSAFKACSSLCDVLLESKPTLANINAFDSLPSNYYIYVPRTDLSWFETETNWSTIYIQGHIVAIEDHIEYLESIGFDVEAYKEVTP